MAKWRRSSADSQSNFTAFWLENDNDDEEIFSHCFVYMGVKIIGKLTMLSDYSDLYKKPNYIYSFEFENKNMNDIDKLFEKKYGSDYDIYGKLYTRIIRMSDNNKMDVKYKYRLPFSKTGYKSVAGIFSSELIMKTNDLIKHMSGLIKSQKLDKDFIQWNNRRLRNDI